MAQRQPTTRTRKPPAPGTVDPNVDQDAPRVEGEITTLDGPAGIFVGETTTVDDVVEAPMPSNEPSNGWWIVRPNEDIEQMSVGTVENSYSFRRGTRYKVPFDVMTILAERDYLLEQPYPA